MCGTSRPTHPHHCPHHCPFLCPSSEKARLPAEARGAKRRSGTRLRRTTGCFWGVCKAAPFGPTPSQYAHWVSVSTSLATREAAAEYEPDASELPQVSRRLHTCPNRHGGEGPKRTSARRSSSPPQARTPFRFVTLRDPRHSEPGSTVTEQQQQKTIENLKTSQDLTPIPQLELPPKDSSLPLITPLNASTEDSPRCSVVEGCLDVLLLRATAAMEDEEEWLTGSFGVTASQVCILQEAGRARLAICSLSHNACPGTQVEPT